MLSNYITMPLRRVQILMDAGNHYLAHDAMQSVLQKRTALLGGEHIDTARSRLACRPLFT